MKVRCRLLTIYSFLFLFVACDKDNLPKPTQEGKNTMAALVNGKRWVASPCWGCTGNSSGKTARYILNDLSLSGQEVRGESNIYIHIDLKDIDSPGSYVISSDVVNNNNHRIAISFRPDIATGTKYYYASPDHTITVIVTRLDFNNKIVSGTFSGTARNVMGHEDTITVTNGRFDLVFDTH